MLQPKDTNNVTTLESCGFAKMSLMFCVILCHSCAFWTNNWITFITPAAECTWLGILANWLGTFQIPAFVFISGYIYTYIKEKRGGYSDTSTFIRKKIHRLIYPYFFITLFWLIPFCLLFRKYTLTDIINTYFITGGEQLWFLYMLFGVFMIFNSIYKYIKGNLTICFITIVCSFIFGFFLERKGINYFQISNVFKYILFFGLGSIVRRIFGDNLTIKGEKLDSPVCLLSLIFINIFLYFLYLHPNVPLKLIIYTLLSIEGTFCAFLIFTKIGKIALANEYLQNSKILNLTYTHNFTIYFFHQQIIYVILFLFNGKIEPELNAMINIALSLTASIIISRTLKKNKTISYMLGE